jgi:hypothetical protein
MDMERDRDMDTDMETDKDRDTDRDMDMDTDMEMDLGKETNNGDVCIRSICRNSPYSTVWITYHNQPRYTVCTLVVRLPNESNDMLIFRHLYCCWDCSPNDVLAELQMSVMDEK